MRYSVAVNGRGPFEVEAELLYQPIGYRWADNLKKYDAPEPKRFNGYYDAMGPLRRYGSPARNEWRAPGARAGGKSLLAVELDFLVLHAGVGIHGDFRIAGVQLPELGDDVFPLVAEESSGAVVVPHVAGEVLRVDDRVGLLLGDVALYERSSHSPQLVRPSRSASAHPRAAKAARSCCSVPTSARLTGSPGSPSPVTVNWAPVCAAEP